MINKTDKIVSPKTLKRGVAILDREKARKDAPVAPVTDRIFDQLPDAVR